MKRLFLPAAALALASLAVAGNKPKTYTIELGRPVVVAQTTIKAGEYKVRIDGSNAIFTDVETLQSFSVPVRKVETGTKKHGDTTVTTVNQNGKEQIEAIQLGGTDETVEFEIQ